VAWCQQYFSGSWMKDKSSPPHIVMLQTDRYDDDNQQQIRQQVIFNDGFGRQLQTSVRHEAGEAWHREENGALAMTASGPQIISADFRWAVSGRTEYDNKGQPVRTYQPYFLDSWKYVTDDSARNDLYASTCFYDPPGRECQVVTAKGWIRRTT